MKRIYILLFQLILFTSTAYSQQKFAPENGDRLVLLGNALIENEQQFGFLEYRLTNYWPEKHLTFRNIGWSGDTVFGDARSYYTNPPGPYDLLISQIKAAEPDWLIIGYGNVEAQQGAEGLDLFKNGMNQLLDSVEAIGAKAILLSTIPQISAGTENILQLKNNEYRSYNQAIKEIALKRKITFLDVFDAFNTATSAELYENNGIHLNEKGYAQLAETVMNQLGLNREKPSIEIDASTASVESNVPVQNISIADKARNISFNSIQNLVSNPNPGNETIKVNGLKKGNYSLSVDGKLSAIGSRKQWEDGIILEQGPSLKQSKHLLELIREKDKIYFQQYRPQNRTYILGFRSYEQGRHKEGLEALDALILWLDDQINQTKKLKALHYQLEKLP
ncbi:GDSL-type esterase/lipase family protein [Cyclobacterium marinum]|uniref:Lipolytic protein G-D-S-L family n=1 Tax=Cyclobacterium marinum (strain ATCC 25205 / DSM 745 / LMG 13164 / NCIMB 1802) TaxID=880070 RepID=G0J7T8_CYCMS|nr:GDSL-type esterase/lipase family protein [Cyclobacterium marinum]AEL27786.1 lipolytic protein G-D-S-L family [Cyclobacterium marinum DSM 745]